MAQFNAFIFSSVLFCFILSFLVFLYVNAQMFLPYLGVVLKLRNRIQGYFSLLFYVLFAVPCYIGISHRSAFIMLLSIFIFCILLIKFPLIPFTNVSLNIILFSISLISVSFPKFLFILLSVLSLFAIFTCVPSIELVMPRNRILSIFILTLEHYKLLKCFLDIYFFYFSRSRDIFLPSMISLYLLCFIYQLFIKSRAQLLFFEFSTFDLTLLLVYAFYVMFLFIFLNKSIINLSSLLWGLTANHQPDIFTNYLAKILDSNEEPIPPSFDKIHGNVFGASSSNSRSFSLFHRSNNQHYHSYNVIMENSKSFRYIGLFGGLLVGGATIYYMRQESQEMTRQNDLEEVSQGFRTEEWYKEKYAIPPKTSS